MIRSEELEPIIRSILGTMSKDLEDYYNLGIKSKKIQNIISSAKDLEKYVNEFKNL